MSKNSTDDVVRDVLRQAFASVDREYFESISESLASRVVLRFDAPNNRNDATLAMLDAATVTGASATIGESSIAAMLDLLQFRCSAAAAVNGPHNANHDLAGSSASKNEAVVKI